MEYIKLLIILLALDLPMIFYFNRDVIFPMFKKINNNQDMEINNYKIISGIIAFLLIVFALQYFIIKNNLKKEDAFILGIIIYGIYNTTNYFTINNYSLEYVIRDTLWGGILLYLVVFIYSKKIL